MNAVQESIAFPSSGDTCRGLFLRPDSSGPPAPCVVAAHGFGGTIDAGLLPFAERFVAAGLGVLLFDYRHFGSSDGKPRQWLSIRRQLEDYGAALAHARSLPRVDPDRIALFGTSFSGGHVVRAAARDGRVAAVISQCPMMDGLAALGTLARYAGFGALTRITWHGLRDAARTLGGRAPHRVPIVGPPGSLAAMTSEDAEPGYRAIAPPGWRNEVCARIALSVPFYRPGRSAGRLTCPHLIQICLRDTVAPASAAEAAARRAGSRATVKRYDIGHFDLYLGDAFQQSVSDQVAFLQQTLRIPT